jgi:ADP-ribose pyrophosphatase YjhB (NUDIX family)
MTERFCTACAGTLVEREIDGHRRLACPRCGRVHYVNPAPAVGAIILKGDHVLLCKRGRDPLQGWWDLPGGFMEVAEHPEDAVARELREETGMRLQDLRLLGVWPGLYDKAHTLNLIYAARAEGEPVAASDVAELHWFSLHKLPENLAWPHEREALRMVARGLAAPSE